MVALSSCEAGYIAASSGVCQGVWLMNLFGKWGNNVEKDVTLSVDKVSTIKFANNPIAHGNNKHVKIRFHYLRVMVCEGNLMLGYC